MLPEPSLAKNEKRARWIIGFVSLVVFIAVALLARVKLNVDASFNVHVFALVNAIINSVVSVLLLAGLVAVLSKKYQAHEAIMITAISLSILFLLSYIAHHLLAGVTKFGDTDRNGIVTEAEKLAVGGRRTLYYFILLTHVPLAAIILPFILFTAYRALSGDYEKHKKIARITWPIWFYVAVTGVALYWMIEPYYE